MTNEGTNKHPELVLQPFDAKAERNDYEVRGSPCCYAAYRTDKRFLFLFFLLSQKKKT